jgi:hypothetical protein
VTDGFVNGEFTWINNAWTYEQPHAALLPGMQFGSIGADYDPAAAPYSDDSRFLLVDFFLGERLNTEWDFVESVTSTFETEVRMCPGVKYELDFRSRRIRGDERCVMTLELGDEEICSISHEEREWYDPGPWPVPFVEPGMDGVRQTPGSTDMYVKVLGTVTCRTEVSADPFMGVPRFLEKFWNTYVFDSFSMKGVGRW